MRRLLLCMLALAVGAGVPAADAIAKSGGGGSKTTHPKKAKKKKPKSKRTAASTDTRGAKGDKGDKGDPGAKGDKGDTGSSVVNRTRLASPTSTGDDSQPIPVPLTAASWTAAPDEGDDWAGSVTFTVPTACDDQTDPTSALPFFGGPEPGGGSVIIKLDDRDYVGDAYMDWSGSDAGRSVTVPITFRTGRTLNGDTPTTHSFTAETGDWCGSTGQSFTITDLRINVYGSR